MPLQAGVTVDVLFAALAVVVAIAGHTTAIASTLCQAGRFFIVAFQAVIAEGRIRFALAVFTGIDS